MYYLIMFTLFGISISLINFITGIPEDQNEGQMFRRAKS